MKKIYKIYELVRSTSESLQVCGEYGYGAKVLHTNLLRDIDDSDWSYDKTTEFKTLEEAEQFIEQNIKQWDCWTIVCEYSKNYIFGENS